MTETERRARELDEKDPLHSFREAFLFPKASDGSPLVYLAGNSLGLQPSQTRAFLGQELDDWEAHGVEGHFRAKYPWLPYHELVSESLAKLAGAKASEVVAMNSLTVNLHLMMVSFYRPTKTRFRILIEHGAFPSDRYAVASQARFHGLDPKETVVSLSPRPGELTQRTEDIVDFLEREGESVALVLFGNVNYLTGQAFDVAEITKVAQSRGCVVGWDLAHGMGNLALQLHDWNVDFAVWCGYKYLNGGPGAIAGAFVHERHVNGLESGRPLPRFEGWWGHDKTSRFRMPPHFEPIPTVEAWQLSNPPIFQLAALRASLQLFDQATVPRLRAKAEALTGFLAERLAAIGRDTFEVITPKRATERGCQLSLRVGRNGKDLVKALLARGVVCDFREPDILRAAPVPLYNSFLDVCRFADVLEKFSREEGA